MPLLLPMTVKISVYLEVMTPAGMTLIMMATLIPFSQPFMELLPLVERIIQSSFVIREISNLKKLTLKLSSKV